MNWNKVLMIGVAGGITSWLYNFLMHGFIMRSTYVGNSLFVQEDGNPLTFLLVEVMIALTAGLLFVKTRSIWAAGVKGGATFGLFIGLFSFFPHFINPLIFVGFPYYLGWCWGAISLVNGVVVGSVAGAVHKG